MPKPLIFIITCQIPLTDINTPPFLPLLPDHSLFKNPPKKEKPPRTSSVLVRTEAFEQLQEISSTNLLPISFQTPPTDFIAIVSHLLP